MDLGLSLNLEPYGRNSSLWGDSGKGKVWVRCGLLFCVMTACPRRPLDSRLSAS